MKASILLKQSLFVLLFAPQSILGIITTLERHDPIPPYTTGNTFALLGTNEYEYLKGTKQKLRKQHFSLEIMPFYQRASRGGDGCGCNAELGDICGLWNMIALLPFNGLDNVTPNFINTNVDLPCGYTFPRILEDTRDQLLTEIDDLVNPTTKTRVPLQLRSTQGLLQIQQTNTTLSQSFGFFSTQMKYKKQGVRFNGQLYIGKGFGVTAQSGFADIRQCAVFIDQTPTAQTANPFNSLAPESGGRYSAVYSTTWVQITKKVSSLLMSHLDEIISNTQICYNSCDFHDTSIEDIYLELFWRQPITVNRDVAADEYPKFLFIPYVAVGGSFGVAKERKPWQLVGLAFGNNGHNSLRARAGLSLDFYETVQLSLEGGITAFNKRRCNCYPVPNNTSQWPIFPFRTSVDIEPGANWHVALAMNAEEFFDRFSFYFDYVYMSHDKDCIKLVCENNAAGEPEHPSKCRSDIHPLRPDVLWCKSDFSAQVFDGALNYAISPYVRLGIMMQIPFKRRQAYRSSTFAASIYASF